MRLVYSFLMYLLTPYLLFRLWWKGRHSPEYRKRIGERFSWDKADSDPIDIWIHAVSLGEVIAATPLIDSLLQKKYTVLITTMTPTGSARVKDRFGDTVAHRYIPYDLPGMMKRFFKQVRPKIGIVMETELWPNLVYHAHAAKIPLLLVNARLSEQSLKGYLRLKFLFKPVLNNFSAILTQSDDDAARFNALGAREGLVQVLGNIKFDLQTNPSVGVPFYEFKKLWGAERVVVIAASTHEDEESQILSHLRRLQLAIPQVILLIAPRHPERFNMVYQLACRLGFNCGLRSNSNSLSSVNDVVVLDSLGELMGFYQLSDYAFVGGSLVPVGGHNVLEPIALQVPALSGQHVHNFKTICRDLAEAEAIVIVNNSAELIDSIINLNKEPAHKQQMISNATNVLERNKGSINKYLQKIELELMQTSS